MRVFFEDREGKAPPKNARFFLQPFNPKAPLTTSLEILPSLPEPLTSLPVQAIQDTPDLASWHTLLQKNTLPKVVLGRKRTLTLKHPIDPFALTASLKQKAKNSYLFCIEAPDYAFLGATPERLFFQHNDTLFTEALAGTRPIGKTPQEEKQFEQELLSSSKEQQEWRFVQTFLKQKLLPFCKAPLVFAPTTLRKTSHVQHLYAPAKAELKPNIVPTQLLKALHPTPALCGTPTEEALDFIQKNEPFDRGLFGGVLGYTTPTTTEAIVLIRSALLEKNQLHLFSACGILPTSDPEKEWEELNAKLQLFGHLL